jgi:hypothetical protein
LASFGGHWKVSNAFNKQNILNSTYSVRKERQAASTPKTGSQLPYTRQEGEGMVFLGDRKELAAKDAEGI